MPFLIAGLLLLWLASKGMTMFVRANPAVLARMTRTMSGFVALIVALFMLVRGRIDIAIGLGGLGFWLVNGRSPNVGGFGAAFAGRRNKRVSRVRSAVIEMELDHASGTMTGSVLAGPDEGTSLDQLNRVRCFALYARCLADDPEGGRLLEAYFDRRFAGWRETADGRDDTRGAKSSTGRQGRPGSMSEDEAHEVLGLAKRATREEITRAHRALMKKFHPDHGGSTDLAARVNEAKDVLMRRHP